MIAKVEMYTIVCDNCGVDIASMQDYSCWHDSDYAEQNADESDWIKEGDKHYCPDCFSYDDDDNIIIKAERKNKYADTNI